MPRNGLIWSELNPVPYAGRGRTIGRGTTGRQMKTKTFTGRDERDLAIQIQDWKSFNPHIVVKNSILSKGSI
jgi:hypothetical protein